MKEELEIFSSEIKRRGRGKKNQSIYKDEDLEMEVDDVLIELSEDEEEEEEFEEIKKRRGRFSKFVDDKFFKGRGRLRKVDIEEKIFKRILIVIVILFKKRSRGDDDIEFQEIIIDDVFIFAKKQKGQIIEIIIFDVFIGLNVVFIKFEQFEVGLFIFKSFLLKDFN